MQLETVLDVQGHSVASDVCCSKAIVWLESPADMLQVADYQPSEKFTYNLTGPDCTQFGGRDIRGSMVSLLSWPNHLSTSTVQQSWIQASSLLLQVNLAAIGEAALPRPLREYSRASTSRVPSLEGRGIR